MCVCTCVSVCVCVHCAYTWVCVCTRVHCAHVCVRGTCCDCSVQEVCFTPLPGASLAPLHTCCRMYTSHMCSQHSV